MVSFFFTSCPFSLVASHRYPQCLCIHEYTSVYVFRGRVSESDEPMLPSADDHVYFCVCTTRDICSHRARTGKNSYVRCPLHGPLCQNDQMNERVHGGYQLVIFTGTATRYDSVGNNNHSNYGPIQFNGERCDRFEHHTCTMHKIYWNM